jgi:hypothetical protein
MLKFLPLISIHMIAFGGIGYAHVCCGSIPSRSHHQSPSYMLAESSLPDLVKMALARPDRAATMFSIQ